MPGRACGGRASRNALARAGIGLARYGDDVSAAVGGLTLLLPARVHQVRWRGRDGRVLAPARPLTGIVVISPVTQRNGMLVGSRADLLRLGAWIRMAAVSPHSIVYVACRSNPHPFGGWREAPDLADLVIVRSDVGLRPSAWKSVRAQLRSGHPGRLRAPEPRPEEPYRQWVWTTRRQIAFAEHAATLVLTAPAPSLLELGDTVTAAGDLIAGSRDIHRHGQAHLVGLAPILRGGGDYPHEFDIVGHDPLFHKRRIHARVAQ